MSYCGKACQKVAWPSHKKECRRIVREKAKMLDKAAADYAADEAIAAHFSRLDGIPEGAECYICKNDKYWKGDLVRGCSCRGPHAGFVHIRCLVKMAEIKGEDGDHRAYGQVLNTCGQCRQNFQGPVAVALARAMRLRYAGRAETDYLCLDARRNMAAQLYNAGRPGEVLELQQKLFETYRRVLGPNSFETLEAEERMADLMRRTGGIEGAKKARAILMRILDLKRRNFGYEDIDTLHCLGHVAAALHSLGKFSEEEAFSRDQLAGYRKHYGELHVKTFTAGFSVARSLVLQGRLDEAREIRDQLLPLVKRVMGPDFDITRRLEDFPDGFY